MKTYNSGLWRHGDFMKLWTGQTISQFGSQITALVIPLVAVLTLKATPIQMGLLVTAGWLPFLLIGWFAGVWVDRYQRKAILIITDVGRALLLLLIPLCMLLGILRIEILFVVTLLVGFFTVFFDIAYTSFLPALVGRAQLVEGNSKLTATQSAARIAGPGIAGPLMQLLGAPLAILFDILSFAISALFVSLIHTAEPQTQTERTKQSFWRDVREGLQEVTQHPVLRAMACSNGTANLFWGVETAAFVLYVTRVIGINSGLVGFIFASQNVGLFAGTFLARKAGKRFGVGPTIIITPVFSTLAVGVIALAAGPLSLRLAMLVCAHALIGCALMIYTINQVSLQQSLISDQKQGRVNATMRFIGFCISPLGALIGGVLGEYLGLRQAMLVAAAGLWLALPWLVFSPLRGMKE